MLGFFASFLGTRLVLVKEDFLLLEGVQLVVIVKLRRTTFPHGVEEIEESNRSSESL